MEHSNGYVTDTRANMTYDDLYKYDSVISSTNKIGFGTTLQEFSHGDNSGHCGIQLALLLGYKKIYLLGFDMTAGNVTHFHQSYKPGDQESFKRKVPDYAQSLLTSLKNYQGSQEIINLSAESILAQQHSNVIKTQIFAWTDFRIKKWVRVRFLESYVRSTLLYGINAECPHEAQINSLSAYWYRCLREMTPGGYSVKLRKMTKTKNS